MDVPETPFMGPDGLPYLKQQTITLSISNNPSGQVSKVDTNPDFIVDTLDVTQKENEANKQPYILR